MTRSAKLYTLNMDCKTLAEKVDSHKNQILKQYMTIFQLPNVNGKNPWYAIISLDENIDLIVEEFGAVEVSETDYLRTTLHDYYGDPIYGEKSNIIYLNKVPS